MTKPGRSGRHSCPTHTQKLSLVGRAGTHARRIPRNLDVYRANPVVAQLVALGITPSTAVDLSAHYDAERILHGITYTLAQQQEGKVNNPAGFLVEAIKKGYRDHQPRNGSVSNRNWP